MANRKTAGEVREKIQAQKHLRRLEHYAFSTPDPEHGNEIPELSAQQVKVSLALLNKVVPDLRAVEIELGGKDDKPEVGSHPMTGKVEDWQDMFGSPSQDRKPH